MDQKGFANIALILIIIVLVGAGGYFIFYKKSEPITQQTPTPQNPTPPATQTQNNNSQTTATQDKTASWKTYTNTKYDIEFKYPSSLALTERERTHPTGDSFEISFRENNSLSLTVVVYLKNPTGDIDQSLNYIKTNYKDAQKIVVNNYPALRYFNGNKIIIFSGQKSYSFGNDVSGKSKPLTATDFNTVVNSVSIQN